MADEKNASQPLAMMIQNVSLEEFERAVYSRNHEESTRLLLQSLQRLKVGGQFVGYPRDGRLNLRLYTRFCAAVTAMLCDPEMFLSQEGVDMLAAEHATMDLVFRASSFESSDHLLAIFGKPGSDPTKPGASVSGGNMIKFMITYSLRSLFGMSPTEVFSRSPAILFSTWAGMIAPMHTISEKATERRDELLGIHNLFADLEIQPAVLPVISDAYMYSSYGLRPDKHEMKGTVHRMLARSLAVNGAPIPSDADMAARRSALHARLKADPEHRPTLLIAIEWFLSVHAMFRCYATLVRQLRTRFRLVGMSRATSIDDAAKELFDEWYEIPPAQMSLGAVMAQINAIAPDVIYYPSLGMAMWWVAMASVRLAPLQVMTLGHPASSQSPCMDCVIVEDGAVGDPSLFTERILTIPYGSARFVHRSDAAPVEPMDDPTPETVHIAVPAMLCKLNSDFMAACKRISDGAGRPVVFHFFVNMLGVNLFQAAREIREWLPTAQTYERMHYNDYMGHLRKCHLHLCTFPFGGTNSNVDSMLLGIPLLAREGPEPHERFDAMMIRKVGLSTVVNTTDAYVAEAIRLVNDDEARGILRRTLLDADLHALFFGESPTPDAFPSAIMGVLQESIQ